MKFKIVARWVDLNDERATDLPSASGIIDAATPKEAYDIVKTEEHPNGFIQMIEYILSEDGDTIYFHPKLGWLFEPLVKYVRPKAS